MMSWISKLNKTYDSAFGHVEFDESRVPLLPISHTTVRAQISVTVDFDGNFVSASVVPKEAATTVIPCTEASGSRTSGKAPHPLCDTLEYVAGDLTSFCFAGDAYESNKIKETGKILSAHKEYLDLLKGWCESDYGDIRLSAVFKYVEKGILCSDLVNCGILRLDGEGKLIIRWGTEMGDKPEFYSLLVGETEAVKSFVRWSVTTPDGDEDLSNPEIWRLWRDFYDSDAEGDMCMVTGEKVRIIENHPSKIRNSGDKAKLISSNDDAGFTFRGRFINGRDACTVGYSVSHKAHNALRWLIGKQGYRHEDWCIVSWAVTNGSKVVNPAEDPVDIFTANLADEESIAYTGKISSDRINAMIRGYNGELDEEGIVTMILDSASKGRLAVIYYREFSGSEFEENLNHWYTSCSWPRRYKGADGKGKTTTLPPSLKDIVRCAYGWKVDDALLNFSGHGFCTSFCIENYQNAVSILELIKRQFCYLGMFPFVL
jgi:CRISPR-associated protein Csd1